MRNVSHRLVAWTLPVAVLGLALVSGGGLGEGGFEVTPGAFLLLLLFVHTGLPAAYLAWTRSEESYDEEDEAVGPETG
ncbi:hypothetical protein [Allosalinactinospora lopnorensis]|uniref:hypothetical protein n=1 Tax=Allosalinactinospora lopnorensis TaxID=1352348 RepID=UPI000623EED4|nr:hypothetical protein [Allosalinactinospora lopnorensis]